MTADIFLEGGTGSGSTVCATRSSPFYLFNNVLSSSTYLNNGVIGAASGQLHFYNNTLVCSDTTQGACLSLNDGSGGDDDGPIKDQNNVLTSSATMISASPQTSFATIDHNVYANAGRSPFVLGSRFIGALPPGPRPSMARPSRGSLAVPASTPTARRGRTRRRAVQGPT